MLTDGALMRLGKEDFRKLLNEPMLEWVTTWTRREIVIRGGKWLDVRLPSEFEHYHIEGAINVPLYFMRLKLKTLDRRSSTSCAATPAAAARRARTSCPSAAFARPC